MPVSVDIRAGRGQGRSKRAGIGYPAALHLVEVGERYHRMVRPRDGELLLRIKGAALARLPRRRELILGHLRSWSQSEHMEPAGDFFSVDPAVIPICRPEAAEHER